ncbi:MAG: hypothetical protein ABIB47_03210 [Candidatus Woesearchaeota archaeon]
MGKGQIVSLDLILSIVVFILLIGGIIAFWNIYILRFNANIKQEELALKATKITDLFVESQGVPTGWNETNVQVIGLVDRDRRLSSNKLASLLNVTYAQIKTSLNIDANEFYFRVVDLNGALVKAKGNFVEVGNSSLDVEQVIEMRRFALYGNQKVVLEFSIWE